MTDHDSASPATPATFSRLRVAAVLAVLTVVNVVNVMDRSLLGVLAEPVRREFHLSDTQLGLLTGMAFAVVYGLLALPVSRIADRGRYRQVIAVSLFVWAGLTSLSGLSRTFWQLAALRVGVAGGEAGLNPAGHALISRLFPPSRRGFAIAVFSLGVPIGAAAGTVLAGLVAHAHGWRSAFFVMGPVGLVLLPLLLVLPRFPASAPARAAIAWTDALRLLRQGTYLKLWLASAMSSCFSFATGAFAGPFLMRTHGFTVAQVGAALGAVTLVGVGAGAFAGGLLFDAVARRRPGLELVPAAGAMVVSAVAAGCGWLWPDGPACLAFLTLALFSYGLTAAPTLTAAQNLAPVEGRAGSSALMGLSTGVVGFTLGPLLVGLISDRLRPSVGPGALGYALAGVVVLQLGGAIAYALAARDMRRGRRGRPASHAAVPAEPLL